MSSFTKPAIDLVARGMATAAQDTASAAMPRTGGILLGPMYMDNTAGAKLESLTDAECTIGDDKRFQRIRAALVESGDLHLKAQDCSAHWILREMPDYLCAINVFTGKSFRVMLEPIVDFEA